MHKFKTFLTTIVSIGMALFVLTFVGCTTNSITGAQLENPSAIQSTSESPSSSSVSNTYDYNGADVEESYETNDSGEDDGPRLSTDPNSHYNL